MQKRNLPVAIALVGGAIGLFLRRWQLTTGFEPDTGLAIPGDPACTALLALSALVALVLLALIYPQKGSRDYDVAFDARSNELYMVCTVLAAFLLLGSGVMELLDFPMAYAQAREAEANGVWLAVALPPMRVLSSLVGAGCTLLIGRNLYKGLGQGKESLTGLGLCLLLSVWLVTVYQRRAIDPVTQNYLYEVLCVVFALMGIYYFSGWSFQNGKLRRSLFCFTMAVYFSLVTLADPHSMADRLRFGFVLLFFAAHALLLLQEHPAPAETPTQQEHPAETPAAPAETEDIEHG